MIIIYYTTKHDKKKGPGVPEPSFFFDRKPLERLEKDSAFRVSIGAKAYTKRTIFFAFFLSSLLETQEKGGK